MAEAPSASSGAAPMAQSEFHVWHSRLKDQVAQLDMSDDYNDSANDLIEAEQLKSFVVVELFCEICADLTPHHLDESKAFLKNEEDLGEEEVEFVKPLSNSECTFCRENEESYIDNFDS